MWWIVFRNSAKIYQPLSRQAKKQQQSATHTILGLVEAQTQDFREIRETPGTMKYNVLIVMERGVSGSFSGIGTCIINNHTVLLCYIKFRLRIRINRFFFHSYVILEASIKAVLILFRETGRDFAVHSACSRNCASAFRLVPSTWRWRRLMMQCL